MSSAERFIDKYKELERAVRSAYAIREKDSVGWYLSERNEFQKYKDDIQFCQKVRNFLQHEERIDGQFAIEPNERMIQFLDELIERIRKRPRCRDIAIRKDGLFTCTAQSRVLEVAAVMHRRQFSHVPLLERGRVTGVFSERTMFRYLAEHDMTPPGKDLRMRDIGGYVGLDQAGTARVIFVRSALYVEELQAQFEAAYRTGRRIELAFLTAGGKPEEPVQGMVTPWDIRGKGL